MRSIRVLGVLLIGSLCGCASTPSPCDYSARPTRCTADEDVSIDVDNGVLVLLAPKCSKAVVQYADTPGSSPVTIVTGRLPIAHSNRGASVVPHSCWKYPER